MKGLNQMELVEPIRDKKKIETMKKILKAHNVRDYALFTLGINSGLRISDILKLKVSDAMDEKGRMKDRIVVHEKKTEKDIKDKDGNWIRRERGKGKSFKLSDNTIKALSEYLATRDHPGADEPLFASRKHDKETGMPGHMQRAQAYRIINGVAKEIGLATDTNRIGTHTLRKTFGYHAYKAGTDLAVIQDILNHSSPGITLRYIGITQDEKDDVYVNLNL